MVKMAKKAQLAHLDLLALQDPLARMALSVESVRLVDLVKKAQQVHLALLVTWALMENLAQLVRTGLQAQLALLVLLASTVKPAQMASQALMASRVSLVLPDPRVRLVMLAGPAQPVLLALLVLSARLVPLDPKALLVSPGLTVERVLLATVVLKDGVVRLVKTVLMVLAALMVSQVLSDSKERGVLRVPEAKLASAVRRVRKEGEALGVGTESKVQKAPEVLLALKDPRVLLETSIMLRGSLTLSLLFAIRLLDLLLSRSHTKKNSLTEFIKQKKKLDMEP